MLFYSRARTYVQQRVCSVSLIAVLWLLYLAFWNSSYNGDRPSAKPPTNRHQNELTHSQFVFVCYTVFVHVVALIFPFRLCWGTASLTRSLRKAFQQNISAQHPAFQLNKAERKHDLNDSISIELESKASRQNVLHAIILPNYKEDIDTLRETLAVLACHLQASSCYDVYLAMEQGETGSEVKANTLIAEFATRFHSIECTLHPRGIPGEAQGKSSNLCWASRYLTSRYDGEKVKKNVIVTVIDADSHLSSRHFSHITKMHLDHPETADTTIYVPPIIFDRNAHHIPTIVRVADLFWGGAGLSGHLPFDPIAPPTSVYSLPLSLVDFVGGWDAGNEAIGEDLHMYVKCFFATKGNLTCRSVFSAASQSNVSSPEKGIGGFIRSCNARYRQALRHMWGALDSGYVFKSASEMLWKKGDVNSSPRPHWVNTILLFHRMFEAHFLPAHLALLIVGGGIYAALTPTSHIPILLQQAFDVTAYIRMTCLFNFTIFLFLYESYHYLCLKAREEEMVRAGLADRMYDSFSYRSSWNWLDYFAFPVTGVLFGSIPALVALVCHFWTLSLVYKVSKKPLRMAAV